MGGAVQCLNPWDCESKRQYEVGGVYRTLDAGNGAGGQAHGVCYSPAAFMGGQGAKAGSIAYADDGSTPTLKSAPSGGNTVPDVVYAIEGNVVDREAKQNGMGVSRDQCPTLNSQDKHAVTYAIEGQGLRNSHEGPGYAESDAMYTLNTIERHAVCFQQNQREEARDMGGASGDLSAEPGSHQQNYVCYKQSNFADYEEGVGTLKASGGDAGGALKASSSRIYDARGNGDGKTIPTLTGDHENRITDYTALCVERKVDE